MKLQNLALKLEKHHKKKIDLSLDRTFNLLKKLGNPHHKLKNVVNVVGTNASCEVVDKSGNIKGYITKKELQKTLTKS